MASPVEFILSLIDKVSGPATKAAAALGGTSAALEKVKGATASAEKATGPMQGPKQWKEAKPEVEGFAGVLADIAPLAAIAGVAMAALGGAILAAGIKGAGFAAEMANFREDTEFALTAVLGSADKARGVFDLSQQIAETIGGSVTEVAGQMNGLLRAGFSIQGAKEMVQTLADLKAINPGTNLETFALKLRMMQEEGFASTRTLKEFEKSGVNLQTFFGHLSKDKGISISAAKAALKAGTVTADQATVALKETLLDMGGGKGLGSIAESFSTSTITGRLQRLHGTIENLFLGLDTDKAGEAIGRVLDKVTELLNPNTAAGARTLDLMNQIAEGAGDLIDYLSNPNAIGKTFNALAGALEKIVPLVMSLGGGLFQGLGAVLVPVASGVLSLISALGGAGSSTEALQMIGKVIGVVAAAIFVAVAAIAAVIMAIPVAVWAVVAGVAAGFNYLRTHFTSLVASAREMGGNLVDGITEGISSGIDALISSVEDLGESAIKTLKRVLQIHSPSKVMEELGAFTAEGFTIGIQHGTDGVQGAAGSLGAAASSLGARSGGGSHSFTATINVSGAHGDPEDIGEVVRTELGRWWEEIAVSAGGLAPA